MTTNLTTTDNLHSIESVLIGGDLSSLSQSERMNYYSRFCESLGLNALAQPFAYIRLNGKLKLYALREATEQLRKIHNVSVRIQARELVADSIYVVTAPATLPDGRCDESIGAVSITGLQGEALANAVMKAETKSKRRVTLSIFGLAFLDETEVDSIPGVRDRSHQVTDRIDSSVCKSWKSPQDAILWAEQHLLHLSLSQIQAEFDALEVTHGKKAPAWVARVPRTEASLENRLLQSTRAFYTGIRMMIATDCKNDNFSDVLNQLDDFGLTPNQFRVYCHLWRSAVDGVVADESGERIAKICGLTRITAMRVLSQLSMMHLIECEVAPGKKTIYHLLPYSSWRIPVPQEKKQTGTRQSKVVQFRVSHTTQPNADTCKAAIQVNETNTLQQGRQDNPMGLSCLPPASKPVNEIDVSNPETGSLDEKLAAARERGWRDTGTWWNDLGQQVVTVNRFVVSVAEFMQRSLDSFDVGRQACESGLRMCIEQIEKIKQRKNQQQCNRAMAIASS